MTTVLAIDQGTSATKAVVADESGPLVDVDVPVTGTTYDDPRVEQDPLALLDSVMAAGRAALSRSPVIPAAIGLGNQGETVRARSRRTGEPLVPALSGHDRRAYTITEAMDPDTADALLTLTGLPLDPYFAAPKMAWLRRELGDAI
ncbi:MAG: FGGY family carbohydrate kinase, partial [Actinomycetota bacterium]